MIGKSVHSLVAILMLAGAASAQTLPPRAGSPLDRLLKATDLGDVMLIVDFSQSMWEKVDGRPKHETAADATQQLLDALNKNSTEGGIVQPVGLMLYGHRAPVSRKNCNDIEILVPPGPVSNAAHRNRIMGAVRQAQPRGMTPISASLRQAAEALKYRERPATLILVSDGVESCHTDPCAEAKLLHEQGVRLIAHVVGYAVKPHEFEQLKCIADATGGMSVEATRASDLASGMRQFADAMVKDARDRLVGSLAIDVVDSTGRPMAAADFDAAPEIVIETKGEDARRLLLTGETQVLRILAAPYRVRLQDGREYAATDVEVRPGQEAHARLQVGDGKLEALFRPATEAPAFPAPEVVWQVNRGDVSAAAASAVNPAIFKLATGRYTVAASIGGIVGAGDARILPDGNTHLEIMPQPPFAQLAVRLEQPVPTLFATTQIPHRMRVMADTSAGEIELARGSDAIATYVPPGEVRVLWVAGERSGEMKIAVPTSGASRSETLPLPSVEWSVEWIGDAVDEPFKWEIEELLDDAPTGQREIRTNESRVTGTIPPGSYRVTVSRGPVATTADITVLDGPNEKRFLLKERL